MPNNKTVKIFQLIGFQKSILAGSHCRHNHQAPDTLKIGEVHTNNQSSWSKGKS